MPEHIHKYKKVLVGGKKVVKDPDTGRRRVVRSPGREMFKCTLPGCPHFIIKELVEGRKSICWKCGAELILNSENTRLTKPTHKWCRKTKELGDDIQAGAA